jgi:hypothetical protein
MLGRIVNWDTWGYKTHWEYVVVIAFQKQQWLHERTLLLHVHLYVLCIACLVNIRLSSNFINGVYVFQSTECQYGSSTSDFMHENELFT